jgi:hypothetical protein
MAGYMGHRLFVTLSGGGVEGYFAHETLPKNPPLGSSRPLSPIRCLPLPASSALAFPIIQPLSLARAGGEAVTPS